MSFLIRNDEAIEQAIKDLLPDSPVSGRGGQMQEWYRTVTSIAALGPELAPPVFEVWYAIQRIATRRHENRLHEPDSARMLFFQEYIAFEQLLPVDTLLEHRLNRMANILYYNVYAFILDCALQDFQESAKAVCAKLDLPVQVGLRIAAAKYLNRSLRESKDINSEEQDMLHEYHKWTER